MPLYHNLCQTCKPAHLKPPNDIESDRGSNGPGRSGGGEPNPPRPAGPTAGQVGPWSMKLVHGPCSVARGRAPSHGRIHSIDWPIRYPAMPSFVLWYHADVLIQEVVAPALVSAPSSALVRSGSYVCTPFVGWHVG